MTQRYSTEEIDKQKEKWAREFHETELRHASKDLHSLSLLLSGFARSTRELAGTSAQYGESVSVQRLRIDHSDILDEFFNNHLIILDFLNRPRNQIIDFCITSVFRTAAYAHHQIKLNKQPLPGVLGVNHSNETAEQLSRAGFLTAFSGPNNEVFLANHAKMIRDALSVQTLNMCWHEGIDYIVQRTQRNPKTGEFFLKQESLTELLIANYMNVGRITKTVALMSDQSFDYRSHPDLAMIAVQPKDISELYSVLELLSHCASDLADDISRNKSNAETVTIQGDPMASKTPAKSIVFISYSHKDKKFLDDLQMHLKPLEREGAISIWSDKKIKPGSQWMDEIKLALSRTKIAVMMVSPAFLASDFIHEHELNPLLQDAARGGVRILWVPVRACSYKDSPLKNYQAVIPPEKPLAVMKAERDKAFVQIYAAIKEAVSAK